MVSLVFEMARAALVTPAAPAYPTLAPAPAHQAPASHHVAYQSPPRDSMPPLYDQTTFDPVEPLDHAMEDIEPGAASPRDMDMQRPSVPSTSSSVPLSAGESNRLPFHPKYSWVPHLKTMSPGEFRGWLHSDPLAPPMYGSQPTSSGRTRPVSLSSSDSAPLRHRITPKGLYSPITCPTTPGPAPEEAQHMARQQLATEAAHTLLSGVSSHSHLSSPKC
jgi:hypothetical protein